MNILKNTFLLFGAWIGKHYPKQWISFRYFLRFHKRIDWSNPKNLNEKILYLSLMTDTTYWSVLTDKYHVREYVEDCGFKETLVELYGVWDNASDIDFEKLPNSFVLKTNHGSGEIKLVHDKNLIDKEKLVSYFNKAISRPYGEIEAGKHYFRIKPCIVAEQLLINDPISQKKSSSVIDYKFWCFNGKVHYILVCSDRNEHSLNLLLYDRDWNVHPEYSVFTRHYQRGNVISRPENYDLMIKMSETLARPFPCVRVDLYNIGGKIYFGEMTLTSLGGMMNYFTNDFLDKAGSLIDLKYKG